MDFLTISEAVQAEIVEKKSKFIANLYPVENIEEAERLILEIKRKYHDARHNCMAYRIVKDNQIIEKSSDDGEPSGTAGAPMLNHCYSLFWRCFIGNRRTPSSVFG